MGRRLRAVYVLSAVMVVACSGEQLGLPPIPLRVASPDGRFVAFVRNHPNIDPPDQTLLLQPAGGPARQLAQLPPDAWWCDQIVWSADSLRVAFVIANAIVQVYEVETPQRVFSGFVGRRSWDTPPRYVVRDLSLSDDGLRATFRECERSWRPVDSGRQNEGGTRVESSIAKCSVVPMVVAFSAVAPQNRW